jgi:hypothetical protein
MRSGEPSLSPREPFVRDAFHVKRSWAGEHAFERFT